MGDTGARYVFPTARTSLRPVSMEDVEALHRLWTDPEVRRFFWDDEVIPTRGPRPPYGRPSRTSGATGSGSGSPRGRKAGERR